MLASLPGSWDPSWSLHSQKVTGIWGPCSACPAEGQPPSTWLLRGPGLSKPSIPQPRRQEWAGDKQKGGTQEG